MFLHRTRMPALFGICEHALQRRNFFFRSANWGNLREVHHEEFGLLWRWKSWLEVFSRCIRISRLWNLSAASFWSVISFPHRFQRRWSLVMETAGGRGPRWPQQWGRGGGVDFLPALYWLTAQASSPVEKTSRVGPDKQYFLPIADCPGTEVPIENMWRQGWYYLG